MSIVRTNSSIINYIIIDDRKTGCTPNQKPIPAKDSSKERNGSESPGVPFKDDDNNNNKNRSAA